MEEKKDGIYIWVQKDEKGGQSHAVGINLKLRIIYVCMETHEHALNIDNYHVAVAKVRSSDPLWFKVSWNWKQILWKRRKEKFMLYDGKDSFSLMPSKVTINDLLAIHYRSFNVISYI